jgi:hypothetical protein
MWSLVWPPSAFIGFSLNASGRPTTEVSSVSYFFQVPPQLAEQGSNDLRVSQ